jgi:hydrogenase/urease accessory protein HupE
VRFPRLALLAGITLCIGVSAHAHQVDRLAGTSVFDAQRDSVDPRLVAASAARIIGYVTAHVGVTGLDGSPCEPGAAVLVPDGDGVIFRNTFSCGNVTGDIVYRSTVLTASDPGARQVVLIGEGANAPQALLDASNTTVTLSAPAPSLFATMQRYLVTGIEHIFLGYDHIAFLVGVVLWARRIVPVIKIVTAFTIAHSITLSLAALNIVVIPSIVVEPAIAASIVFVAMENFFSRDIDGRWRVTFVFGLIHGFGFAGALREVGLPANAIVTALAAFNVGVEIGQVAIVSLVVPGLMALDRLMATDQAKPVRATSLVYGLSVLISLLGSYWLVTRMFEA